MKMVSAAKLRRAQQAVVNSRPYSELLEDMIGSVAAHGGDEEAALSHPLLEQRECRNVLLLVLAGEKGLCGSFNSNVFKAASRFAEERAGQGVELELLGRKAVDFYQRRGETVAGEWEQVFGSVEYSTAETVASKAMERFVQSEVDEVWMLFNRFLRTYSTKRPRSRRSCPSCPLRARPTMASATSTRSRPSSCWASCCPSG